MTGRERFDMIKAYESWQGHRQGEGSDRRYPPAASITVNSTGACSECCAPVGGPEECQKLFDDLLARDLSNALYFSSHRLVVDCYAMQHERYIRSYKSFAAHLTGLCCAVEFGSDPQLMRAIHMGMNAVVKGERPELVSHRGDLTILSISRAADVESYCGALNAWADSTWRAWAPYHELARSLLKKMSYSSNASKAMRKFRAESVQ